MDPNATLARIRELTQAHTPGLVVQSCDLSDEQTDELLDLVRSLDDWLTRGGFPPADWTPFGATTVALTADERADRTRTPDKEER